MTVIGKSMNAVASSIENNERADLDAAKARLICEMRNRNYDEESKLLEDEFAKMLYGLKGSIGTATQTTQNATPNTDTNSK